MNDRPPDWIDRMYALAKNDPWHRECAARVEERTPDFGALRKKLTEEERDTLDLYIGACEELTYSLIYSAYQIGREDQ